MKIVHNFASGTRYEAIPGENLSKVQIDYTFNHSSARLPLILSFWNQPQQYGMFNLGLKEYTPDFDMNEQPNDPPMEVISEKYH